MAKKEKIEFTLTFFDIAYSLGGRANVDKIFKTLSEIFYEEKQKGQVVRNELLSEKEYKVLECMVETYKRDKMFPSWTFLQEAFSIVSNAPIRNLGDFNTALSGLFSTRSADYFKMELSNAIAKADNQEDLKDMVQKAQDMFKKNAEGIKLSTFESTKDNYDFARNAPQGITTGIETVDRMTAGFQQGTIASLAGFTSHGKSTLTNNIAYLNAAMGRKVAVVSLEIIPLLCKYIYLSRHSYTMNKPIEYQTLIRAHLTQAEQDLMYNVIEPDFIEKVGKNLAIIGTEDVPEYSYAGFELLYSQLEEALGGLDLIVWDHVNQFKYVNPGSNLTGDHYIKFLTDLTKTYINRKGNHPVTLFVVQTNREGYKRAARNEGRYELTALSDFNELEKSSTYVMFTFADEVMRQSEQAKVQLLKHRLGLVMLEPENIEVLYKYAMVGNTFTDVISSIAPEREDAINGTFFMNTMGSGSSKGKSDFDPTDLSDFEKQQLQKTNEKAKPVVQPVNDAEQKPAEQVDDTGGSGYKKNVITSVTDSDFQNF